MGQSIMQPPPGGHFYSEYKPEDFKTVKQLLETTQRGWEYAIGKKIIIERFTSSPIPETNGLWFIKGNYLEIKN